MAEAGRGAGRVHARRLPAKQRAHLAALLILALALPAAAQDIEFDPSITEDEFATFSRLLAQGIYATPVDAARSRGLLGFDIGIAVTAVPIDPEASYWTNAVPDDFSVGDYAAVPKIVAAKGVGFGTISASYSKIQDTDISVLGGAIDWAIVDGGLVSPTVALRGAYSQLNGVEELDLNTWGVELFISKGFGPLTPYAAIGRARSNADATFTIPGESEPRRLTDESGTNRYTLGLKLSLFIPKIVVEATQGEERSYAAKVSIGL
jgi:hypothetical protein